MRDLTVVSLSATIIISASIAYSICPAEEVGNLKKMYNPRKEFVVAFSQNLGGEILISVLLRHPCHIFDIITKRHLIGTCLGKNNLETTHSRNPSTQQNELVPLMYASIFPPLFNLFTDLR